MADSQGAQGGRGQYGDARSDAAPANARRPDLQGLRAVAVLLVALNHAGLPVLRGGYIGVDVFFVLSGYFITGVLLRDGFGRGGVGAGGRLGTISIPHFYARRVRRILPAACMTLLVTSLAVYVIYDLDRADLLATKSVLQDALASSLFYANFHFAHTATNYFFQATATLPSPFQHFWSLSVEEQMYVVWPTLLALILLACRASTASVAGQLRRARWACGVVIAACLVGSLVYSVAYTHHDPQAAYFSSPARVYEFAIGALLALLGQRRLRLNGVVAGALGVAGLAMILTAAVLFSATTPFPGAAALLPAVGTGLLILAGMAPVPASRASTGVKGVGALLSLRPLIWIGDRSYTFYLWHYPTLILVWQACGHQLGWGANLGLLAGALALSALTFGLYENPLRFAAWLQQGWRTAGMAATAIGLSLAAILIPMSAYASTLHAQDAAAARARAAPIGPAAGQSDPTSLWASRPVPQVAAAAAAARRDDPLPRTLLPPLSALEADGYDTPLSCQPTFGSGVTSKICKLGDPHASRVVVMIGDSHSGMWDPAIINDARAHGFAVVPLAKSGCQLGDYSHNRPGWPCGSWFAWARAEDRRLHPVATVVTFLFQGNYLADPRKFVPRLGSFLAQMSHPVLLSDMPYQHEQPGVCVTSSGANDGRCSTRVPADFVPFLRAVGAMTQRQRVPVIPTLQWFCGDGICPMVVDHTLTVRDRSHLTMDYVNDLTGVFSLALNPILARLEAGGDGPAGGSGGAQPRDPGSA